MLQSTYLFNFQLFKFQASDKLPNNLAIKMTVFDFP